MKRLFSVGINEFKDPSATLHGCVNDVANIRQLLVSSHLGFDPKDVRLLCDKRATRLNIFERLDWCTRDWPAHTQPSQDFLVANFSCHGSQVVDRDGDEKLSDNQDEVLCPYDFPELWDSPKDAPDAIGCGKILGSPPKPQICDDDLAVFLKRIPKGVYTVLIVDACHAGSISKGVNPPHYTRKAKFIPAPFDIKSRGLDRSLFTRLFGVKPHMPVVKTGNPDVHYIEQNHILLSGCRDDQTSADAMIGGAAQGAMTWSFMLALKDLGWPGPKTPTWLEVHAKMLSVLKDGDYPQVPQLTGPQEWLEAPIFGVKA